MNGIARLLVGALVTAAMWPATAREDYRIHSRTVPSGFEAEAAFLELLKWPKEPVGVFDANKAPKWNVENISNYISDQGVDFSDVNHFFEGHVSKSEIIDQLKERQGKVFRAFAHLSHIYSIPFKQYSELAFEKADHQTAVTMATCYKLTFESVGGSPKIVRWEYTMLEGE
jgi:hypothetical protein